MRQAIQTKGRYNSLLSNSLGHSLKILLITLLAFAQSITYAQELEITTYTANDGLSQNSVKGIIADKNGRLWIATAQGINTFDGSEFVNFVSRQPNYLGMINQSVEKLAMDSKGNIWLAENNGAISKNRLKIDFTIRQVFYKSWWFISLSFIAFAGGIIFYLQRRNKQKRQLLEPELRSNRKLTSEKSRISRELHDNAVSIATTLVAILTAKQIIRQSLKTM